MPSVEEAMRRSMGTGALESIARALGTSLERRDAVSTVTQQVNDFKTAISSWDNCMAVTYCKWPLIAIIILGGLIIGSILWCIVRRLCCGLACCCSCFSCFKCCGNCCGCCDPPRRKTGYMGDTYRQTNSNDGYNFGYKPQPAMMPIVPAQSHPHPHAAASSVPQYAEFDTKRGGGEDALPAMPSWEESNSKKVMVEEESVEMEPLKKPQPSPSPSPVPAPAPLPRQNPNLAAGAIGNSGRNTPVSRVPSPAGPYGHGSSHEYPYGQEPHQSDYNHGHRNDQQGYAQQGYWQNHNQQDYRQDYPQDQPYGGAAQRYDNRQAYDGHQNGYADLGYGNNGYNQGYNQGYGGHIGHARQPSPTPSYPAGARDARGASPHRTQFADMRSASPMDRVPPSDPGSPRLINNAGFDFNSGFSRPQTPKGPATPRSPTAPMPQAAPGRQPAYGNGYHTYSGDHDELHGV